MNGAAQIPSGAYETLPSRLYTDGGVFAEEQDRIFARAWLFAGHRTQVAAPGDYFTCRAAGENLIVIHGQDGEIRAFHNLCRHRGHALLIGAGQVRRITCAYHAWTYDDTGALRAAPNMENVKGFDPACHGLRPVRLEVFHGLIFVNLEDGAQPFAPQTGAADAEIAEALPSLETRVFAHRTEALLKANWKVAIENFAECYHCQTVHKTFVQGVVQPESYRVVPRGFCELHDSVSRDGTDRFQGWRVWPLMALQSYPGGIAMTFRWIPLSINETKVEVDWWLPAAEPTPEEAELIRAHAETTFAEDIPLVESVQAGLESRGFETGLIMVDEVNSHRSEHGVKVFQDLYRREMGL
ncbi:MAG: aromatic ring-hydroxylating dioxygenase subunit alpha [Paracoccaceae bacterium]|nr:aromatic ring-hydroxylating dioxygenase subunit alpha [Paracoccaceae bacterium]